MRLTALPTAATSSLKADLLKAASDYQNLNTELDALTPKSAPAFAKHVEATTGQAGAAAMALGKKLGVNMDIEKLDGMMDPDAMAAWHPAQALAGAVMLSATFVLGLFQDPKTKYTQPEVDELKSALKQSTFLDLAVSSALAGAKLADGPAPQAA